MSLNLPFRPTYAAAVLAPKQEVFGDILFDSYGLKGRGGYNFQSYWEGQNGLKQIFLFH